MGIGRLPSSAGEGFLDGSAYPTRHCLLLIVSKVGWKLVARAAELHVLHELVLGDGLLLSSQTSRP